jgi:signal transduction histidine kinase
VIEHEGVVDELDALRERLAAIREVHHDLANALAVVSGYLELLEADRTLPAPQQALVEEARQAAEQAQELLATAQRGTRAS